MSDLIRRKDAIEVVCELVPIRNDAVEIADAIRAIPSAERKGEWILESGKIASFWVCSECDIPATVADEINDIKYFNYCPNCGARMKGAEDE